MILLRILTSRRKIGSSALDETLCGTYLAGQHVLQALPLIVSIIVLTLQNLTDL
jgi:hypothetical protein